MKAPTPQQIRETREAAKLSQSEAATLVHATRRTWQNWEAPVGSGNHRTMDLAAWELFETIAARSVEAFARVTSTTSILSAVPPGVLGRMFGVPEVPLTDEEKADNAVYFAALHKMFSRE